VVSASATYHGDQDLVWGNWEKDANDECEVRYEGTMRFSTARYTELYRARFHNELEAEQMEQRDKYDVGVGADKGGYIHATVSDSGSPGSALYQTTGAVVPEGASVQFRALAKPGYDFVGWEGAEPGYYPIPIPGGGESSVSIGGNAVYYTNVHRPLPYTLKAKFEREPEPYTLTVINQTGYCAGWVAQGPARCHYADGQEVVVTATPQSACCWKFDHWEGEGTTTGGVPVHDNPSWFLQIEMNKSRTLTAFFQHVLEPRPLDFLACDGAWEAGLPKKVNDALAKWNDTMQTDRDGLYSGADVIVCADYWSRRISEKGSIVKENMYYPYDWATFLLYVMSVNPSIEVGLPAKILSMDSTTPEVLLVTASRVW